MNNGNYLTRQIAEELILELYSDVEKYVRREDITKTVLETHLQRGGLEPRTDPTYMIKKALANLQKKGLALNRDRSVGYWIFCSDFTPSLPYAGMVFIPTLAKEMILEFFAGKVVYRTEIVETLTRVHSERGGDPTPSKNIISGIKEAGRVLKKKGLVQTSVMGKKGLWQVYLDPVFSDAPKEEATIKPKPRPKSIPNTNEVVDVGKTIGNGDGYIYVYYYPVCHDYAELHKKSVFPCKISETGDSPLERVKSQLNESTFQYPVVGLTIRTNNRKKLEGLIHGHLDFHGKHLDSAHGTEWFMTSPAEVERIYKRVMNF